MVSSVPELGMGHSLENGGQGEGKDQEVFLPQHITPGQLNKVTLINVLDLFLIIHFPFSFKRFYLFIFRERGREREREGEKYRCVRETLIGCPKNVP